MIEIDAFPIFEKSDLLNAPPQKSMFNMTLPAKCQQAPAEVDMITGLV